MTPYERKHAESAIRIRRLRRALLLSAVPQVALAAVGIWLIADGKALLGAAVIGVLALGAPSFVKTVRRTSPPKSGWRND